MNVQRPSCFAVVLAALAPAVVCAPAHGQVTAPLIDTYGDSLTTYQAPDKTLLQDLRPRFDQRGTDIDGTLRAASPLGWSIAADTMGGGYSVGRRLGDVALDVGAYAPLSIDLALPTIGPPVVIGRTFSAQQAYSSARYDSDGYQGVNWANSATPEIVLYDADSNPATLGAGDVLYLVYGADRYVEFKRHATNSNTFKAKNGAAGVVQFDGSGADTYTYYDGRGSAAVFFGFDTDAAPAKGQLWKMVDAAGHVAYAGDATTKATALTAGYDADGRPDVWFDASGRRYTFTYSTLTGSSTKRLTQVVAEIDWSTTPVTVGTVDYDYYDGTTSGTTDDGLAGDLRMVTVTLPVAGASDFVTTRYYRYYTLSHDNSDGRRGHPHTIKMAVGPEGVRKYGASSLNAGNDASLKSYSDIWMEYNPGDYRVAKAIFNGECGCGGGGTAGLYAFTYGASGSYASDVTDTDYDGGYGQRTVILQPDTTYVTQYFDETGQVLSKVLTNTDPGGSPTKTWVYGITRDSAGLVTGIATPAALDSYTHSTGAVVLEAAAGLITQYSRESSGNLAGLRNGVTVLEGTGATPTVISGVTLSQRQMVVGDSAVTIAVVDTSFNYPTAGGSAATTAYTYTWWDNSTNTDQDYLAPKVIQTALPAVATANNGANSATSLYRYLRADGTTAFTKDADGIIGYMGRSAFGQTAKAIQDVDTAATGDIISPDAASTWSLSSSGTAYHIITTMSYDNQGRHTETVSPGVNGARTRRTAYVTLGDGRLATMAIPRYASSNYYGPVRYSVVNHAGKPEISATIAIPGGGGSLPSTTLTAGTWANVHVNVYDDAGSRVTSSRAYHSITTNTWGTGYDETAFGYDAMGRRIRVLEPSISGGGGGTIHKTVYEERGLPTEQWMGTNDSGGGGDNMVKVSVTVYDGGNPGGNGHATSRTLDADGNWGTGGDQRQTTMLYDWRGRLWGVHAPASPHTMTSYDNLNRAIATGQYSGTTYVTVGGDPASVAGQRIGLGETMYDERGRVYRSKRYAVTVSSGATSGSIQTDTWYNPRGQVMKTTGARITKAAFDRVGRQTVSYLIAKTDDNPATYADAVDVAGDVVLEETHTGLHAATGAALFTHHIMRLHDDPLAGTTGALDTNADADDLMMTAANVTGRVQITAMWYDEWDRVTDTVHYGTNHASANKADFDRDGLSVPSSADATPRTSTAFDDFGRVKDVTDPEGHVTRTVYDDASRRVKTIQNYDDGVAGGGTFGDKDRITEYAYSGGKVVTVTVDMPGGAPDQVTTYVYGTTLSDSNIATGHLSYETIYAPQYMTPDPPNPDIPQAAADRTARTTYNALSEVKTTKDPAGNVMTFTRDALGRVTVQEATTIISGFDTRVKKIETSYNARGMVSSVLQKSAVPTVLDQTDYEYDAWGNLAQMWQDPDSSMTAHASDAGRDEFVSGYSWQKNTASGGWTNLYLASQVLPAQGSIALGTGSSGDIDYYIGRTLGVLDSGFAVLSVYQYLGAGTAVLAYHAEPSVYAASLDPNDGTPAGTYPDYLDRFNRPIKSQWIKDVTNLPAFVDFEVTAYERSGLPKEVVDHVLASGTTTMDRVFDQLNTYTGLHALRLREEGLLSSGSISKMTRKQVFERDVTGRATSDKVDLDGSGTYLDAPAEVNLGEMDDSRTINARGEITKREILDYANPSTPRTVVNLTYDKNGNMTSDGRYDYTYSPWCKLVEIKVTGGNTIAKYEYGASGAMLAEQLDTNDSGNTGVGDGEVDAYDPVFYLATDTQGRRVGVYRDQDQYPKETFVYHPDGVRGPAVAGGVMLRDRNDVLASPEKYVIVAADADRTERLYYCSDFRSNVSALVWADGTLAEQVRYSATGIPFGIPLGDVNGDGKVESTGSGDADFDQIDYLWKHAPYTVRGDLDLDGDVDKDDQDIAIVWDGVVTGRSVLSGTSIGSRFLRGESLVNGVAVVSIAPSSTVVHLQLGLVLANCKLLAVTTPDPDRCLDHERRDKCFAWCERTYDPPMDKTCFGGCRANDQHFLNRDCDGICRAQRAFGPGEWEVCMKACGGMRRYGSGWQLNPAPWDDVDEPSCWSPCLSCAWGWAGRFIPGYGWIHTLTELIDKADLAVNCAGCIECILRVGLDPDALQLTCIRECTECAAGLTPSGRPSQSGIDWRWLFKELSKRMGNWWDCIECALCVGGKYR